MLLFLIGIGNTLLAPTLRAQEPQLFARGDFDLHGNVKSCMVITDYGKEEFEFDKNGLLIRSVTRYNQRDYDITYYKYQNDNITEKRDESYRDGQLDKATSIAHFYTLDTVPRKRITEKILSYNQEFLEKYEYVYDAEGNLVKITRSNNDGLDETTIRHTIYKGETTIAYLLNGVIQKSIRSSVTKSPEGSEYTTELTKEFLDGLPIKAIEKQYDTDGKVLREIVFEYNSMTNSLAPITEKHCEYNSNGMLATVVTKTGVLEERKVFIYQFDNSAEKGNWVKKIITPENAYTTRRIEYYPDSLGIDE